MPASHFTMWAMLTLMLFGAVGGAVIHGNVLGSIRAAYPSDLAKREALHRCGEMNTSFSRFSEQDRDACYRAIVPANAQASSKVTGEW